MTIEHTAVATDEELAEVTELVAEIRHAIGQHPSVAVRALAIFNVVQEPELQSALNHVALCHYVQQQHEEAARAEAAALQPKRGDVN